MCYWRFLFFPYSRNMGSKSIGMNTLETESEKQIEEAIQEALAEQGEFKPLNEIVDEIAYDKIDGWDQD